MIQRSSLLLLAPMKSGVFWVFCIFAFVSLQDAVAGQKVIRSDSLIYSPTKMPPGRTTVPKLESSGNLPTSYPAHKSHPATSSTRTQKTLASHTRLPKNSGTVPTRYPTISRSSQKIPVMPTTGMTSTQKTRSPSSRGSGPEPSRSPKSSPLPATTTTNPTTTQKPTITPTLVSASKTLTVSNGHTVSAQVGWVVVGVGIGGAVAVGDNLLPVAGGIEAIIEENSSGQDELSTVHSDTTTTTTSSTSTSKSTSKSSSTASPTPYNIYPKRDSTLPQQSAFAQHLEQIAQPGSVRGITGGRDQLLLWVASLTPTQASELSRNPVVSPLLYIFSQLL